MEKQLYTYNRPIKISDEKINILKVNHWNDLLKVNKVFICIAFANLKLIFKCFSIWALKVLSDLQFYNSEFSNIYWKLWGASLEISVWANGILCSLYELVEVFAFGNQAGAGLRLF